jgi:cardiolipin synthase A/B
MTWSRPEWIAPIVSFLHISFAGVASGHIILTKRDVRAAIGWIGLVWLSPFVGSVIYLVLGINHIRRKAMTSRTGHPRSAPALESAIGSDPIDQSASSLDPHVLYMDRVTGRPLLAGNSVKPLWNGEEAYPAMLEAIGSAKRSIGLSSYIFNYDSIGERFVDALGDACRRGVEVRVLVDAVGSHYHLPTIMGPLRRASVRADTFLPSVLPLFSPYSNLRNHRKIMVVDGRVGFTGGMNIDEQFDSKTRPGSSWHDLHFRIEGPVVDTLREVFTDDWAFRTGEILDGETWAAVRDEAGEVRARGVIDGPDTNLDRLFFAYLGALDCARESVAIVTPYFVPDPPLVCALNSAAMRGVTVDVFLPKWNNLALLKWASTAMLSQILERHCRVWAVPPPFDHTKLMLVDRDYTLLGSGNWDERSLRLNFEFNVECYDESLAAVLRAKVEERRRVSEPITLSQLNSRSLPIRLRDGAARLLSPYL